MTNDQLDEMFNDPVYVNYQKRASQPMRDGLREALEMALKHIRIEMQKDPKLMENGHEEELKKYAKLADLRFKIEEILH